MSDYILGTIRQVRRQGTNFVVRTIAGAKYANAWADGTNSDARFNGNFGIAVGESGNLYVADAWNNVIRQITPIGTNWVVTTIAGQPGVAGYADGTNGEALFSNPTAVVADSGENLYVGETGNCTIRELAREGTNWVVTTIAGQGEVAGSSDGTNGQARFSYPAMVAIDDAGRLFIAEGFTTHTIRQVRRVGTNWVVTTIGGLAGQASSADGIGSAARFNDPIGIAVDEAGRLFISDGVNRTIRMGTPALPELRLDNLVGSVALTWPSWATDFVLETSPALVGPGAIWTPVTNGIVQSGDSFFFTNGVSGSSAFYRLRGR